MAAERGRAIRRSDCIEDGEIARENGVVVRSAIGPDAGRVVVMSADGPEGAARLEDLALLLDRMQAAGVAAMPRVLGVEPGSLVHEDGAVWSSGRGRRVDPLGSPATCERVAVSAARESLEAMLGALHASGIVLGLAGRPGLAIRADGTVLVRDLSRVHEDESLAARLADRRWLDEVLGDDDRTLLRPRTAEATRAASDGAQRRWGGSLAAFGTPSSPRIAPEAETSEPPGLEGPGPGTMRRAVGLEAVGLAVEETHGQQDVPWLPAASLAAWSSPAAGADPSETANASLSPSATVRPRLGERARTVVSARPLSWRALAVTAASVSVLTATAVLIGVPGGDAASTQGRQQGVRAASAPSPSVSAAPTGAAPQSAAPSSTGSGSAAPSNVGPSSTAPPIDDPAALVSSIALARRERIIGGAADVTTLPGSPASEQDARLAEAYAGRTVTGWSTTVLTAEVIAFDSERGAATVRARIQESERTVTAPDGSVTNVAASPEHDVVLELVWSDGRWLVQRVEGL